MRQIQEGSDSEEFKQGEPEITEFVRAEKISRIL